MSLVWHYGNVVESEEYKHEIVRAVSSFILKMYCCVVFGLISSVS